MRSLLASTAAFVACVALPIPAVADADASALTVRAASASGWIALTVDGPPGTTADIAEQTSSGATPIASVALVNGHAVVARAAAWGCVRRRTFTATAPADAGVPPARVVVDTPSCANRVSLHAPATSVQGRPVTVTATDRWKAGGVDATVCARSPDAVSRCTPLAIPAGHARARVRVRPTAPGHWSLRLKSSGPRVQLEVRPAGRLRVLATGDSMIQIIDGLLAADLGGAASLRSDAHISTGITKPFLLDWPALARRQAVADRPDVTVMFLGANDGFPIGPAPCCTKAWIAGYAARQLGMMRTYLRGGRAQLYWMLLPAPRPAPFQTVFAAVNAATRIAAKAAGPGVHLVDVGRIVAPGGRFHATIGWHGQTVSVRQPDGIHLNVEGARIAAALIAQRMHADGLS